MNILKKITALILTGLVFTACQNTAWDEHISSNAENATLFEIVASNSELSQFKLALEKTGYDHLLASSGSLTVFAPVNSAWTGVNMDDIAALKKMIGSILIYKTYFSDNESLFDGIKAVNGKNIFYNSSSQTFNGAKLLQKDLGAQNGVLHVTDLIPERKDNLWELMSTSSSSQYEFIQSLNRQVMDMEKSVALGVNEESKIEYDTAWINVNTFLEDYQLDNEDSIYTYVIIGNTSFSQNYDRYKPYFNLGTANEIEIFKTDSVTKFNVCKDFVFRGINDLAAQDTLVNVDGVKVPVKDMKVTSVSDCSNGRIYVVEAAQIPLKNKIKPIVVEGEDFVSSSNNYYLMTRYKRWASGERDVILASGEAQSDSLYSKLTGLKDSIASKTYFINSSLVANVANFHIAYKINVNSAAYDLYYVAYDDIADHFDHTYTSFGTYKVVQKVYMSMPGEPILTYGTLDSKTDVANNYLGTTKCFVGETLAGYHELTKLSIRSLTVPNQLVDFTNQANLGDVVNVPKTGTMTLWLTNTARSASSSRQGLLFIDYFMLVPRITE